MDKVKDKTLTKSGWCMAGPPGSRPKHKHCKASVCGCECHPAWLPAPR